jgi:hypothetical protein
MDQNTTQPPPPKLKPPPTIPSKKEALAQCNEIHQILLACLESPDRFSLCMAEQTNFWNCYRKARNVDKISYNWSKLFGIGGKD